VLWQFANVRIARLDIQFVLFGVATEATHDQGIEEPLRLRKQVILDLRGSSAPQLPFQQVSQCSTAVDQATQYGARDRLVAANERDYRIAGVSGESPTHSRRSASSSGSSSPSSSRA